MGLFEEALIDAPLRGPRDRDATSEVGMIEVGIAGVEDRDTDAGAAEIGRALVQHRNVEERSRVGVVERERFNGRLDPLNDLEVGDRQDVVAAQLDLEDPAVKVFERCAGIDVVQRVAHFGLADPGKDGEVHAPSVLAHQVCGREAQGELRLPRRRSPADDATRRLDGVDRRRPVVEASPVGVLRDVSQKRHPVRLELPTFLTADGCIELDQDESRFRIVPELGDLDAPALEKDRAFGSIAANGGGGPETRHDQRSPDRG
jgi:hypothetical protein